MKDLNDNRQYNVIGMDQILYTKRKKPFQRLMEYPQAL